jgi:hypothetical protein
MSDDLRITVLAVLALVVGLVLGWVACASARRRRLARKQAFFGLPAHSESLLVVAREAGSPELTLSRADTLALLELAALVKDCGAHPRLVTHDAAQQSFGERTEFCIGTPAGHRRMTAHIQSLLPGVTITTDNTDTTDTADSAAGGERDVFRIGGEQYRVEPGKTEYVLLARVSATKGGGVRPVFLMCGQRPVTHQAAARYLAQQHERLARKNRGGTFAVLLKVVNSAAYGSDVVELVADVTKAALSAPPLPAKSHRAS